MRWCRTAGWAPADQTPSVSAAGWPAGGSSDRCTMTWASCRSRLSLPLRIPSLHRDSSSARCGWRRVTAFPVDAPGNPGWIRPERRGSIPCGRPRPSRRWTAASCSPGRRGSRAASWRSLRTSAAWRQDRRGCGWDGRYVWERSGSAVHSTRRQGRLARGTPLARSLYCCPGRTRSGRNSVQSRSPPDRRRWTWTQMLVCSRRPDGLQADSLSSESWSEWRRCCRTPPTGHWWRRPSAVGSRGRWSAKRTQESLWEAQWWTRRSRPERFTTYTAGQNYKN